MTQNYIAFLRGINVGGHHVKMDQLRNLFIELGLTDVRSYINSGNIFFNSEEADKEKLAKAIEEHLLKALGYEVPTFLRTVKEVESILSNEPFKDIELNSDKRFCVVFTKEPLNTELSLPQQSSKNDVDLVAINPYEAFIVWRIVNGRPPSGKFQEDIIPSKNTVRFYHTLTKILTAAKSN